MCTQCVCVCVCVDRQHAKIVSSYLGERTKEDAEARGMSVCVMHVLYHSKVSASPGIFQKFERSFAPTPPVLMCE